MNFLVGSLIKLVGGKLWLKRNEEDQKRKEVEKDKMKQHRVKGYLRKIPGKRKKVRIKPQLRKLPKRK